MTDKQLLAMLEEASVITDQLNNLDFSKPEEDALFFENLNRLETMHDQLSGNPTVSKPKTTKYLQ